MPRHASTPPTSTTSSSVGSIEKSSSTASSVPSSCHSRYSDEDGPVRLSPRTQRKMLTQIHATVDNVLDSMVGDHPPKVDWRPRGAKKDIFYYVDNNVSPDQTRFCCVSETTARAEDVVKLFLVADTETLLKNNRVMYDNILNARLLSVLEKPTREEPFKSVYIRYSSYAAPKPIGDRDLCLLVATNVIPQDDGSTIGYCLWDSVEIPECPGFHKSRGLVRSRMTRSGFFCRTACDGPGGGVRTKVVYLIGMEIGGAAAPKFAAWLLMEKFGSVLSRLCNHFRRKHLDSATFRPRSDWPSTRDATHCRGCAKLFHNAFTTRHHCVSCGQVFCKPCYTKEELDLPGVGIKRVRICFNCLGIRGLSPLKPHEMSVFSRATPAVAHVPYIQRRKSSHSLDAPQLLNSDAHLSSIPYPPTVSSSCPGDRSRTMLK